MADSFDIQSYMTRGVQRVVTDTVRATLKQPREAAFMARFALATRRADKRRAHTEREGIHVPPFLIASITSACNLHCAGCYSRQNSATTDTAPVSQLTAVQWRKIFDEAKELGVSFILLAGGEPLLRRDVIQEATQVPDILFPVFTNGVFMDEELLDLLDEHRNIVPILSIEGGLEATEARRGAGVYDWLISDMDRMSQRSLLFGASITVTTENVHEVTSAAFLDTLSERGCKVVIYVEFVPVTEGSEELAPSEDERAYLEREVARLREDRPDMVFISFPGDEKESDGCVAAGRGFFHINSHGGAEPCPFSPFSDINVAATSLETALDSPLFRALRDGGYLLEEHRGGCVLFERRDQVEALMQDGRKSRDPRP